MRPRRQCRRIPFALLALCALGAGAVATVVCLRPVADAVDPRTLVASQLMLEGMREVAAHRARVGPAMDPSVDLNDTGLIGSQFSRITTTVGTLEAKRTSTNPNIAGLLVRLLSEVGVREGDMIAVGASGSFPALILAVLCAAQAIGGEVAMITSLGSSQWGANLEGLTWLDIEDVLRGSGTLTARSSAATVGGDLDTGHDLTVEARTWLENRIAMSSTQLISDPSLPSNVATRMAIYHAVAGGRRLAAFVNIGGAWANLGTDASALGLVPGMTQVGSFPPPQRQGVIHAMALEGIPVIHLLDLRRLAERFDLPWDPSPLPEPRLQEIYSDDSAADTLRTAVASVYLAAVAVWLGYRGACRHCRRSTATTS
jgi:poly-gamma-glutamate system protein